MPDYSNRGPSPNFVAILKPHAMAPAGSWVSGSIAEYEPVAWLNQRFVYSKFQIASAFAGPHVVGVTALSGAC